MKIRGTQSRIQTTSIIKSTLGYLLLQFITFEEVINTAPIAEIISCPILGAISSQVKTVHSELPNIVLPKRIRVSTKIPESTISANETTTCTILINY